MVFDGFDAKHQVTRDLAVGQALGSELGDGMFLGCEAERECRRAAGWRMPAGCEFVAAAREVRARAESCQCYPRGLKMLSGGGALAGAAEERAIREFESRAVEREAYLGSMLQAGR